MTNGGHGGRAAKPIDPRPPGGYITSSTQPAHAPGFQPRNPWRISKCSGYRYLTASGLRAPELDGGPVQARLSLEKAEDLLQGAGDICRADLLFEIEVTACPKAPAVLCNPPEIRLSRSSAVGGISTQPGQAMPQGRKDHLQVFDGGWLGAGHVDDQSPAANP